MDNSSAASIAVNTFVAPGEAFRALKAKPRFLLPLFVLMMLGGAVLFIYLYNVDIGWAAERMIARDPRVTEQQAADFANMAAGLPQAGIATVFALVTAVSVVIMLLLQALYFKIVSLFARDEVTYKTWFAVACFCALPTALRSLTSISTLLVNDVSLMPLEQTNPLSFVNLFGLESGSGTLANIVLNLDVMTIWSLGLLVIAHRIIAGRSLPGSLATVLTPLALIIGLWLVL